ncbi:hypothetical protein LTR70_004962 [Exophiala xenobiotica]|nr:hypothetical protein LTR70_004962 [Exophiala xenobiotica]
MDGLVVDQMLRSHVKVISICTTRAGNMCGTRLLTDVALGSVVRIAPNVLVTYDTDLIRKMNAVRSPYRRSDWFKAFKFDADRENVFSETDTEKHAKMRSKVTLGYSGKENPNLGPDMDRVIMRMIGLIRSKYISQGATVRPCDLGQIIQYLTLDIITVLSLGKSFGWLEDEDKYEYIATMEVNVPAMNFMSAVPFLSRLLRMPAIQRMTLPTVKDCVGMGRIKAIAREVIAERFKPGAEKVTRNDMTQSFIEHGLTQAENADESLLQILAGSDTSGTIMRAAIIYITSNPRICRRLQEELTTADTPPGEVISYARALQLPYLNACIKETLRYYPINAGLSPKTVGPEGDTHNGVYLPPGTDIGISAWMVYRHNPVYGPDFAYYRPEGWLESSSEQLAVMEKEHDLIFMYGRFRCLGERIARIELLKSTFELFRRFDMSLINPMQPLQKEENYGLWIQRGLMVRMEEHK